MSEKLNNERQACLQTAAPPGSVTALAMRFLPAADFDGVLAKEALLCHLRDIPDSVSEPSVALAKLAWWREELLRPAGESQHPACKLYDRDGVRADRNDWERLFACLAGAIDPAGQPDWPAFQEDLLRLGEAEAGISQASCDAGIRQAMAQLGAAHLLFGKTARLLSEPARQNWVPLDLQARFQLAVSQLQGAEGRQQAWPLIRFLCGQIRAWLDEGSGYFTGRRPDTCVSPTVKMLVVRAAAQGAMLGRLRRRLPRDAIMRVRVSDVLVAWRQARRLV